MVLHEERLILTGAVSDSAGNVARHSITKVLSPRPAATAHASEFSCSNWLLEKMHKVMNDYSNSSSYGV